MSATSESNLGIAPRLKIDLGTSYPNRMVLRAGPDTVQYLKRVEIHCDREVRASERCGFASLVLFDHAMQAHPSYVGPAELRTSLGADTIVFALDNIPFPGRESDLVALAVAAMRFAYPAYDDLQEEEIRVCD